MCRCQPKLRKQSGLPLVSFEMQGAAWTLMHECAHMAGCGSPVSMCVYVTHLHQRRFCILLMRALRAFVGKPHCATSQNIGVITTQCAAHHGH